jgi:hypothetical protein
MENKQLTLSRTNLLISICYNTTEGTIPAAGVLTTFIIIIEGHHCNYSRHMTLHSGTHTVWCAIVTFTLTASQPLQNAAHGSATYQNKDAYKITFKVQVEYR